MAMIEAEYRRFNELKGGQGPQKVRQTGLGSLATAKIEPDNLEMSRAGRRFGLGNSAAITGIAPVQVLPTTAAQWTIWNKDATRSLVIESIGMYLTSGTPGVGGVLLGALVVDPVQTGASVTGASIGSLSNGSFESNAIVKTGVTITTPTAPIWQVLATNPSPNVTAFAGSVFLENRQLYGSIIVPPSQGLCLNVVAPAGTTPLFAPFAQWVELAMDLE